MTRSQYNKILEACKQLHQYHDNESTNDSRSWGDGTGFIKVLPYIQDLVQHYHAKSMLEIGAGRNLQMVPRAHFNYKTNSYSSICTVTDFLNLNLYAQYDPAVPGIDKWPNLNFDCTILVMVLDNIPDNDFPWWLDEVSKRTSKFCLMCENLYQNLDTKSATRSILDADVIALHMQIAHNFKNRTSSFYIETLQKYWHGPDLYFLPNPTFPPTQSWMVDSLIK